MSGEVEKAVIACVLIDEALIHRTQSDGLIPEHFQSMRFSKLYQVMAGMAANGQQIDLISLKDELEERKLLDQIGGVDQLVALDQWMPDTSHIRSYVERVKAGGVRQRVKDIGRKFAHLSEDSQTLDEILSTTGYEDILSLAKGRGKVITAEAAVNDLCIELEDPDWGSGVMTGFAGLDSLLMGLRPKQLVIVAGRPGMGKTALSVNVLVNFARTGGKGGMFSMEMSHQELMVRILSETSGVPSAAMRANALTKHDWSAIAKARKVVGGYQLFIEDSGGLTVDGLCAQAKEMHRTEGIELLIIDYLQLVDIPPKGSRNDEVSYATRRFKQLAMELDIPVVLLSQLSRKTESRPDKRPNLADLRDSGSIEQDADVVIFVYRSGYYEKVDNTGGVTEIIVQKNRSGSPGVAKLKWVPSITSFVNP